MRRTATSILSPLVRQHRSIGLSFRYLHATPASLSAWSPQPAPPRLPEEEQEIFDRLQRESTGAFSTPKVNQSPSSSNSETDGPNPTAQASAVAESLGQSQGEEVSASAASREQQVEEDREMAAVRDGEEFHPNIRRGAPPEFEGDVNPKTGESGGPKNEPLRWGGKADWSYNGRVTDF